MTRRWALIPIALLVVAAGWLRFASIGRLSFSSDELPHAIAGRALMDEGRPLLPSGRQYRRALAQTAVVGAAMSVFGETEGSARLPSAVVGLATVPLVWLAVRRRFGEPAALAAATVLAVVPLHVAHSRSARFYAAFALAYGASAVWGVRALASGSRRDAALAIGFWLLALHLQVMAVMVAVPLLASAGVSWRASGPERAVRGRRIAILGGIVLAVLAVVLAVPSVRDGALRVLRRPVPEVELSLGFDVSTLDRVFGVVSWWAWIALGPAAVAGLRRAGRAGLDLTLQLLLPALLLAVFWHPTNGGLDARYLLHLTPFVAVVAGIGTGEIMRRIAERTRARGFAAPVAAAAIAAISVGGVFSIESLPGEAHPGRLISRPNWRAAADVIRARGRPDDALLSTGPLATAWVLGRCGDWLRTAKDAAPFMRDGRDVYCGSRLVPDATAVTRYIAANLRGWIVADAAVWSRRVDPAARAAIASLAVAVPTGDRSILVYRWG